MAMISRYRCSGCEVELPEGDGGGFYVLATDGRRIGMGLDPQASVVERETGLDYWSAFHRGLVGELKPCLCMGCGAQFELDLDRDLKRCPSCESLEVRSLAGAIGCRCPRCGSGVIEAEAFGVS